MSGDVSGALLRALWTAVDYGPLRKSTRGREWCRAIEVDGRNVGILCIDDAGARELERRGLVKFGMIETTLTIEATALGQAVAAAPEAKNA